MPLVMVNQPPTIPQSFTPTYIPGAAYVTDPYTGVQYSAYGLTIQDSEQKNVYYNALWRKNGVGSARKIIRTNQSLGKE